MTERETKVNVKSSRFVGTHILTKAKVSIITFANTVCDTFDVKKNPPIEQQMMMMINSLPPFSIPLTPPTRFIPTCIGYQESGIGITTRGPSHLAQIILVASSATSYHDVSLVQKGALFCEFRYYSTKYEVYYIAVAYYLLYLHLLSCDY